MALEDDLILMGLDDDDDDIGSIGGMGNTELIGADDDLADLVMGLDAAIGDDGDLDAILGAAAKKKRVKSALAKVANKMQKLREVDPNAILVKQRKLDRRRRFPSGFVRVVVPGSGQNQATSNPQNLFRPGRVVIPSNIAFDLFLNDVKVGQQSQFVSNAPVPAAVFSEVAIDTQVHFSTAEVGNVVTLDLLNDTATDVTFGGAVLGTVAM